MICSIEYCGTQQSYSKYQALMEPSLEPIKLPKLYMSTIILIFLLVSFVKQKAQRRKLFNFLLKIPKSLFIVRTSYKIFYII